MPAASRTRHSIETRATLTYSRANFHERYWRIAEGSDSLPATRAFRRTSKVRGQVRDAAREFGRPPDVGVRFYLSPAATMIFGVLFCSGCWVTLAAWWISRRTWLLGVVVLAGALSAASFGRFVLEQRHRLDDANHPLVVIAKDLVELRSGNGNAYPPRYEWRLRRGMEVRCLYERSGWLQIELNGGQVGWIPARPRCWMCRKAPLSKPSTRAGTVSAGPSKALTPPESPVF